jgi:WhiB family redox-sensing transcriptional regulator
MINNLWKDYNSVDWSQASCAGIATEEYYPDDRGNSRGTSRNSTLRRVCESCPIISDCANYALVNEQEGFWGGLSARARRDIRRKHNIDEPTYNSPFNDANILAARKAQAQLLVNTEDEHATTNR